MAGNSPRSVVSARDGIVDKIDMHGAAGHGSNQLIIEGFGYFIEEDIMILSISNVDIFLRRVACR